MVASVFERSDLTLKQELWVERHSAGVLKKSGCEHGVIVGRGKTREDFWGNAMGSLLPGFPGGGS